MFDDAIRYAKTALRGAAGLLSLASDAGNAALLLCCLWAADRLWTYAKTCFVNAGLSDPREFGCALSNRTACFEYLRQIAPDAHLRAYWLVHAWVAVVFAIGIAIVAIGGLRWAFWRIHDALAAAGR